MTAVVDVVEYTDPGCVWSWSSEPALRALRQRYGDALHWRRVFGIQIDSLDLSIPARSSARPRSSAKAGSRWPRHTGAPITERLERMHVSTLPASRAARAAERQGPVVAERVLRRLREAVFVDGRPPDTRARIAAALLASPGLDRGRVLDGAGRRGSRVVDRRRPRRDAPAASRGRRAGGTTAHATPRSAASMPPAEPRGRPRDRQRCALRVPDAPAARPGGRARRAGLAQPGRLHRRRGGGRTGAGERARPGLDPDEALERYRR